MDGAFDEQKELCELDRVEYFPDLLQYLVIVLSEPFDLLLNFEDVLGALVDLPAFTTDFLSSLLQYILVLLDDCLTDFLDFLPPLSLSLPLPGEEVLLVGGCPQQVPT